ncbi:4840_t:CDS:10, partial [Dentiscutata erythropus]
MTPQERDFFINNDNPTPVEFFKRFNYTSKQTAVSKWHSVLSALLKVYPDEPKFVVIYQNYIKNKYKQAIEDYFKSSSASILDEEKDSIDRELTKKTGKAIRNRIDDLLPNDHVNSKKPRLTESVNSSILISADSKINKVDHITDLPNEREDESEQFDTRNLLTKKRHSWENVIKEIDIRNDSKKDWIIDKYNLSTEFRNFQLSTIREIEKIPFLSFKTDLHKILCLSNIMLIEQTRPLYLTCVETVWSQICQRQVPPSLPDVVQNMILEYSKLLNAFTPIVDIQKTWCRNFSKVNELSNQDDIEKFCGIQIILRNFLLLNLKANNDNEDTFVHDMLHDLLKEIFRDPIFELIWANSESASSKNRRRNNKENSRGKKPDFKLLVNTNDEILFGEVKSPKYKNLSSLVCQDFVKLANFQSGTLDELVKKYGNRIGMTSFGVLICGKCTGLDVSGRRRSFTHSKIPIHKSGANIGGIVQCK